ncbi:aquaporin family protein [Maricaulaceae bacterium EIL42A08]|nr:aquaporin family protein [Maricaulaceae bacterium EIL42A08]
MRDRLLRLGAEALGTFFLLAAVVGSGIMAERLTADTGLALLANTIATGAALYVLITAFGPVSGAHFNPAVTLAMALRRRIGRSEGAAFVAAQIIGGILGVACAHLMFDLPPLELGDQIRTGAPQWLAEGVATFGLVFFIFMAVARKPDSVATVVALYITAAYWFTASTSFANPAVTIARSLTTSFSGIQPADAPGFILAQLVGAVLATGVAVAFDRFGVSPASPKA